MLDEVLKLRSLGLSVFPVSQKTKTPMVAWDAYQDQLPTIDEVKNWFDGKDNLNVGVGIATGKVSQTFLLDFDFAKHPEASVFFKSHQFPLTWSEETKSGGRHYYFQWDERLESKQTNTTSKLCPGVDTKGYGGYSKITPSEGYRWINPPYSTPLAPMPDWLFNMLPDKKQSQPSKGLEPTDWILKELQAIKPGEGREGRTPTFCRVIGQLKKRGLSQSEITGILLPWAEKYEYPKPIEELVEDQFRRYPPPAVDSTEADDAEAFLKDMEPVNWICAPLLAEKAIIFVAGLPETMKTFAVIDLAIELARPNGKWLGRYPVKPEKVLYVEQERFKGEIQRRFKGLLTDKGLTAKDVKDNLIIKCGSTFRIDLPQSMGAFKKLLADKQPQVVIIDSFATFHTKEESNRQDIQIVMENIKQLRNEFGCSFVIIHHETKAVLHKRKEGGETDYTDMAGSVAIPAAAEIVFNVVKNDNQSCWMVHTKNTMGAKLAPFLIRTVDTPSGIRVEAY